ncbi:hypothetical protein DICA1_C16556 [Diutina catenulata]
MRFLSLLSLVALIAADGPQQVDDALGKQPGYWLKVDNPPAEGFETVTSTIKVDPKTYKDAAYYAANTHLFKDGASHYYGLQPFASGNKVFYSVFGEHTELVDKTRCSGGADGGAGVSCSMDYPWEMGVEYKFESKVTKKFDDGRRLWNGTLIEPSGKRVYIASWIVGKEKGNLTGVNTQWLEYWIFNGDGKTAATRNCQKYGKATFGTPQYGSVAAHVDYEASNYILDKCAVAAKTPNTRIGKFDGGVWVEAGFLKDDGSTTLKTQTSSTSATEQSTEAKPQSTEANPDNGWEGSFSDFGDWLNGLFN